MAVWVQIDYLWGGSMFLLHVYACMRLAQGASNKRESGVSVRSPWRGKVASLATTPPQNDVISILYHYGKSLYLLLK
jgi:hypothetical protein